MSRSPSDLFILQVANNFAQAEHPHRHRDEADTVGELEESEGKALSTRIDIGADKTPAASRESTMPMAWSNEPWASTTEATKPRTISEKNSAGPNLSATAASGGPNAAINNVATVPAKNEPTAEAAEPPPRVLA